jgi:hypothetical protein
MKYCIMMLLLLFVFCESTGNYAALTEKASELMEEAKDETEVKKALDGYEQAFKIYPKNIDGEGLHDASVLASD